jgi:hypothetical protein
MEANTGESKIGKVESIPNLDIEEVITAKGSVYSYLDDGRTQRSKKALKDNEESIKEPQDVLVYVPDYLTLKQKGGQTWIDYLDSKGMDNPGTYEQVLNEYAQTNGKTIRVVSGKGKQLLTNLEVSLVEEGEGVFIALIDKGLDGDKTYATIPVTGRPVLGFSTYDARRYYDEITGKPMKEQHIGNRVIRIVKRN